MGHFDPVNVFYVMPANKILGDIANKSAELYSLVTMSEAFLAETSFIKISSIKMYTCRITVSKTKYCIFLKKTSLVMILCRNYRISGADECHVYVHRILHL